MKRQANHEAINDENPEWTEADFKRAVPFSSLPSPLQAKLRGRPPKQSPKVPVKLRLDSDLLAALRATGEDWQTRVNSALRATFVLSGRL